MDELWVGECEVSHQLAMDGARRKFIYDAEVDSQMVYVHATMGFDFIAGTFHFNHSFCGPMWRPTQPHQPSFNY